MHGLAIRPRQVLCLGAHPDDIEIGCGGTVLELLAAHRGVKCHWVVFSGAGTEREREAEKSAKLFRAQVTVHPFRDGYFPYGQAMAIKDVFEELGRTLAPDIVFTHTRHDRHQDHRLLSDLTWNTFRNHLVLEYEIPKYDGDLGTPNFYVPLSRVSARAKVRNLLAAFRSQRRKRWFTADTFEALMRLRGVESAAEDGFAEAFYARKAVIAL